MSAIYTICKLYIYENVRIAYVVMYVWYKCMFCSSAPADFVMACANIVGNNYLDFITYD